MSARVTDPLADWRRWLPDVCLGLAVFAAGLVQIDGNIYFGIEPVPITIIAGLAVSVGLCRLAPGVALSVAWLVGLIQVTSGRTLMPIELAFAVVAFGCARWGSLTTVWLSGLSIPASVVIAVAWLGSDLFYGLEHSTLSTFVDLARRGGDRWQPTVGVMMLSVLVAPWLAGLVLRFVERARTSQASQVVAEAARDQAEEVAQLREEQAQLARDVHDVVGHSLAVILAQAESAQYFPDTDTARLKRTMENIATSARTSLQDVRQVLASTGDGAAPRTRHADLDSLIDGVRASGHQVVATEEGSSQPLPPELEVVAFRVLQEMLTNALKHGRRDEPVYVERHWAGDLRIEVRNAVPVSAGDPSGDATALTAREPMQQGGGQGLDGMRRRLESVGGRLDTRRRIDPPTFTATAWVPVRSR